MRVTDAATGAYDYDPNGTTGSDSFQFNVVDSLGSTKTATVNIAVGEPGSGGYAIENAAQFDRTSGYLSRDWASSGNTWTLSTWLQAPMGGFMNQSILSTGFNGGDDWDAISYGGSGSGRPDALFMLSMDGGGYTTVGNNAPVTSGTAWRHVMVVSNGGNLSVYVDGQSQPLSGAMQLADLNTVGGTHYIGNDFGLPTFFGGQMADYTFVDGTAHAASDFGVWDASSSSWLAVQPNVSNYGTNGFRLDFADGSNLGNDVSGQGNDWTVNGGVTYSASGPGGDTGVEVPLATDGHDSFEGGAEADTFTGGAGNDQLEGNGGNDVLTGGAGTDTVVFNGNFADYEITYDVADAATATFTVRDLNAVADGDDGTDTVTGVEHFVFKDGSRTASSLVNMAPVGVADSASTSEDTPVTILASTLLSNDTDAEGDSLSISGVSNGVNGTVALNGDGDVVFTPTGDFNGTATFDYTVTDGIGGSSTVTVSVAVSAAADAPGAVGDTVRADQSTMVSVAVSDLLSNDVDVDGDTLTLTGVSNAVNGTVVVNGTNVEFTPTDGFLGTASFDYTVDDGTGLTSTATVTVNVTPPNAAPVAVADTASGTRGQTVSVAVSDLLSNDTDANGDTLTLTGVTNAVNGTVVLNGTTVEFTPDAGFTGSATFDYTVQDPSGDTSSATVTIDVAPPPLAADSVMLTGETGVGSWTLTGSGGSGSLSYAVDASHGTADVNGWVTLSSGARVRVTDAATA